MIKVKRKNGFEKYLTQENKFQRAVAQWLDMQHPNLLWWHTPNEGKRSNFERWLAKILGMRAGVSDIVILQPNKSFHGIVMELKVGKNKCTPAQSKFLQQAQHLQYYACTCYSIDEVINVVNSYCADV